MAAKKKHVHCWTHGTYTKGKHKYTYALCKGCGHMGYIKETKLREYEVK